ncbi:MAG: DNA-protecting protein DprA, partial [Pseudomonadota bacterium]|nr:DNA-protecting protein DprA [Pseudomonadota bacterium]
DEVGVQPEQLGLNVDEQNEKSTANSLATDKLLASVDYDITAIDVIAQRNALSVSQAMASLLEYELRGLVAAVPGGYVKLRGK